MIMIIDASSIQGRHALGNHLNLWRLYKGNEIFN